MNLRKPFKSILLCTFMAWPAATAAGWLNPHMELYPDCGKQVSMHSSDLLALSPRGGLFLVIASPRSDGMDAIMTLRHGFEGMIFDMDLLNDDSPLTRQLVRFTGTVVRRDASIPERVLGGSRGDSFYYVVKLESGEYLLHSGSFDDTVLSVCDKLLDDMN